jgi:hypothetical protein
MGSGSSADTTSIVIIDMNNKVISGVKLQYNDAINSIQFQIHEPQTNTKIWSEKFGGSDGASTILLDFNQEVVLNSIYSLSNQNYIQFLIFGYYSFNCTSLQLSSTSIINQCLLFGGSITLGDSSNNNLIPPTTSPISTTIITTTVTITTTNIGSKITTSNLNSAFVRIELFRNGAQFLLQGALNSKIKTTTPFPSKDKFNVQLSDLSSITFFSGSFINALEFQQIDGSKEIHGDVFNPDTTSIEIIDLTYKVVTGVNVRADWAIRSLQFQLYDPSTNTYSLTDEIGSNAGNLININSAYFGNMEMMNIYSFSGVYRSNYPIEINFGILYIS